MATVIDPVCGMEIDITAREKTIVRGTTYYFCSRECRDEFEADPEEYVDEERLL